MKIIWRVPRTSFRDIENTNKWTWLNKFLLKISLCRFLMTNSIADKLVRHDIVRSTFNLTMRMFLFRWTNKGAEVKLNIWILLTPAIYHPSPNMCQMCFNPTSWIGSQFKASSHLSTCITLRLNLNTLTCTLMWTSQCLMNSYHLPRSNNKDI
jgi:hypothetical protein